MWILVPSIVNCCTWTILKGVWTHGINYGGGLVKSITVYFIRPTAFYRFELFKENIVCSSVSLSQYSATHSPIKNEYF